MRMNCPRCGQPMKLYEAEAEFHGKHPRPDRQVWGCKMHKGKWGVWITIEGLEAAGEMIPRKSTPARLDTPFPKEHFELGLLPDKKVHEK